jgi:hypothetical protein
MRAASHVRLCGALLVLAGVLSGCGSGSLQEPARLLDGWIDQSEHAADVLLTVAQVNATILAIVLGLGIVTVQLTSRFNIFHLQLRSVDAVFLLLYAVLGVIVPLLWSLRPQALAAAGMVVLSSGFIVATPWMVSRAASSALPSQQIELAVRRAKPRLRGRRSHERRLSQAQDALVGIRAGTEPGDTREDSQRGLQTVLLTALKAGKQARAASLVESVLGGVDDGTELRLEQFEAWLEYGLKDLRGSAEASRSAWRALRNIADEGHVPLAERATQLAAQVAAGRVRDCYRHSQSLEAHDELGVPYVHIPADLERQVSDRLKEVNEFVALVADKTPPQPRARRLFYATCELLTRPAWEVQLGDDMPLADQAFEGAKDLYRGLLECLDEANPPLNAAEAREVRHRIERLAEVPMQLLETAQAGGYLNAEDGRAILKGYVKWIDDAIARRDEQLTHALIGVLRERIEAGFIPRRPTFRTTAAGWTAEVRHTDAGRVAATGLLCALAEDLGTTSAQYQLMRDDPSYWQKSAWMFFNVPHWGSEKDMLAVARRFLPSLEGTFLTSYLSNLDEGITRRLQLHPVLRPYDILRAWQESQLRPDVRLSVLLSRWQKVLAEDHLRPARRAREQKEQEARLLAEAGPETRKALEDLFARPENPPPPGYLTSHRVARSLLRAVTEVTSRETGVAAQTYDDWRQAAAEWLDLTESSDKTPDINALLARIQPLSTEPSRVARDFRHPNETAAPLGNSRRRGIWETVFGNSTANDEMQAGRGYELERADLPPRTYCLLPKWEGDYSGYVIAVEEDNSTRLLVLDPQGGPPAEVIPLTPRYLPELILADCLGDLINCTTCFGILDNPGEQMLRCPGCGGTGRLPCHPLLRIATAAFIEKLPAAGTTRPYPGPASFRRWQREQEHRDWGDRVRVFTSSALREHLANTLENENGADAEPQATAGG